LWAARMTQAPPNAPPARCTLPGAGGTRLDQLARQVLLTPRLRPRLARPTDTTLRVSSSASHGSRDRSALVGTMISGGFGLAWALWGASGLGGPGAVAVRVTGIVLGSAIIGGAARRLRSTSDVPDGRRGSMFRSHAYGVIVGLEVVALFGGGAVLGATGHSAYVAAWFAAVVGAHFVAFGRLFAPFFGALGLLLVAGGVAGAAVGLGGGGRHAITAVASLVAAVALLGAGLWSLARTG
jgi:hypothetical protein